ncbi:MAG: hypothetical protein AAF614_15430 [Chloroflexota bacterium]
MQLPQIQWVEQVGTAVQVGDQIVTPQSQALHLETPFGGLVWQRPIAVLVERDGTTEKVPIIDKTRTAVWAIWMLTFFLMVLGRRK